MFLLLVALLAIPVELELNDMSVSEIDINQPVILK